MTSYYSTATVPIHIAIYVAVVLWAYLGGSVSMRHAAIFAAIYFNNIVFELGATIRLDYVVCLSAMLLYVGSWRAKRPVEFWWLAAMLTVLLISSIVASVAPAYSIRKLTILGIYVIGAAVILSPAAHRRPMMQVLGEFLAVGNRVLAVSLIAYLLLITVGLDIGFIKARDQAWLRGPMLNPNTFGSTASTLLILNAAVALRSELRASAHAGWTLVAAACVFLSYTRAAWLLALVFGAAIATWWLWGSGRIRAVHLALAATVVVAALSIAPLGSALGFDDKFASLFALSEGTALDRLLIANEGIQDWLSNPVFGTGFQTYELLVGADEDPTVWVPSVMFVQLLQYGGTGALLCFLCFLYVLHRRSLDQLRRAGGWRAGDVLIPLLMCIDLLVVAYQVTSAIVLAYFWFFAILLAYLLDERQLQGDASGQRVLIEAEDSPAVLLQHHASG